MKKLLLSLTVLFATGVSLLSQVPQTAPSAKQIPIQNIDTTYTGVATLKVLGSFAQVTIENSETSKLSLKAALTANEKVAGFTLSHKLVAGNLELVVNYPANNWVTHSGDITLKVPKGVAIEVENTSGYLRITNASELTVNALTTSGKIFVEGCKGDYALRSTSGDISLIKNEGNLTLVTSSGAVVSRENKGKLDITNLSGENMVIIHTGDITAESTSGKLLIETVHGNLNVKSASAPIKISKTEGSIVVKSFSGKVELFETKGIISTQSGAGNQIGNRILLRGNSKFVSTEGSIKMKFVNPLTEVTFKLLSESGFIQAGTESKKKKLNLGKGPILVESMSTTGGQVFNN